MTYLERVKAAFKVECIAASEGPEGQQVSSVVWTYPRFIHAEVMTHRQFSRNAASSRAIPIEKMMDQIRNLPAGPIHWGTNKPGMQAGEELTGDDLEKAMREWNNAAQDAIVNAHILQKQGLHKQVVNRVLEPFMWMTSLVTTTSWANFLHLRDDPDAQPEIRFLAQLLKEEMSKVHYTKLEQGQWHLPFVRPADYSTLCGQFADRDGVTELLKKVSAARCARVSYLTHDGQTPSITKDLELFDSLVGSSPLHASPTEHQATPDVFPGTLGDWSAPHLHGNLEGWRQHRKMLAGEFVQ